MSLNWNLSKIDGYKDVCYERHVGTTEEMDAMARRVTLTGPDWEWESDARAALVRLSPITHALIWHTTSIGMGSITEKNWQEFYRRVHTQERALGALLLSDGKPHYIGPQDVRQHIGLTTNVAEISAAAFNGRTIRILRDQAATEVWKSRGGE